jgi:hypothetical protein
LQVELDLGRDFFAQLTSQKTSRVVFCDSFIESLTAIEVMQGALFSVEEPKLYGCAPKAKFGPKLSLHKTLVAPVQ